MQIQSNRKFKLKNQCPAGSLVPLAMFFENISRKDQFCLVLLTFRNRGVESNRDKSEPKITDQSNCTGKTASRSQILLNLKSARQPPY